MKLIVGLGNPGEKYGQADACRGIFRLEENYETYYRFG